MVAAMNQNTNPHDIIGIDDKEINARAVGRLVLWSLTGGDVSLTGLVAALEAEGSKAEPPPPVTAKVALHRAIEAVARDLGCEAMLLTAKQIEAVDAILAAITAETRSECDKMAAEIATAGLGKRALETREEATAGLLGRLERYEGLLGTRLDELRAAIDETRNAVAMAKMSLGADE